MIGPPSVKRKRVRSGRWKRVTSFVFVNRAVLLIALRLTTLLVKLVRLLAGGE
jgi:hypothetical protein